MMRFIKLTYGEDKSPVFIRAEEVEAFFPHLYEKTLLVRTKSGGTYTVNETPSEIYRLLNEYEGTD